MQVRKLAHYSIRSFDLEKSSQFYEKVLGFTPGQWPPFLACGCTGGDEQDFGTVHIIGIDPANPEGLKKYLGDKDIPLRHRDR
jgi:catechol 2,3-dioxygenase-like lactoylglutathione lyase family enzyme